MAKFVKDLVDNAALLATMQGGYMPKQEIARLLGIASKDLFNTYYGKPTQDRRGGRIVAYEVSTQVADALGPFLKEQVYRAALLNLGELPIDPDGTIAAPVDMVHPTAFETGEGLAPVDILDDGQKVYGLNDPINGPTVLFPKAVQRPGGKYRIFPSPAAATITYLSLPPTPVYAEAYDVNGVASYDDVNSVDVGWGQQQGPELIQLTLTLIAEATQDGRLASTAAALAKNDI